MPSNPELLKQIETALGAFATAPLLDASLGLFGTLGYQSERRMKLRANTPEGFLGTFDRAKTLHRDRALFADWQAVEFLFQLTDAEVQSATTGTDELAFDSKGNFDGAEINSFLFLAVELRPAAARASERKGQPYTRTELAGVTRAVNRLFDMPVLLLFKHGDAISLGIIHRRLSKRDTSKDVLEKVTLIKDITCADPIRAHIEILHDFALPRLLADYGVANFVALHAAWQKRLGSYALSNEFYREIADWYFWAHHQVADGAIRLPLHCDTEQEKSLFLIRLLTRVIFSWFLVEKRLIPSELFREHRLRALLKDFAPSRDPAHPDTAPAFYRAILQNLFFGTLNMPPENRAFRQKRKPGERYDQNYGITNLWRYEAAFRDPAAWPALAARIPFLNGGLFDCLDDKSGKKHDNFILDGFSDRDDHGCHLPNDLFFGPERTVDLSRDYGEEDKRTARSQRAKVRGLIEILSRYKFTIEENTPLEEEIALDPELLGKVFENLLASYNEDTRTTARKALGAFYTPREIVSYMVDEALKSYLLGSLKETHAKTQRREEKEQSHTKPLSHEEEKDVEKDSLSDPLRASAPPRETSPPKPLRVFASSRETRLNHLFSNKAEPPQFTPAERDALIAAIGRVKILDPACGSGAFPMGALHRLVDLLQKLDPNNESWKRDRLAEARRYRQLLESSSATADELAACDARIADIEKSFDTRYHALDFARKLYLIENAIYGVDIQPIATQIAKLRFFIALVVDQKVDPAAPNLGVRPLPNLETRLVAADTLIPVEKTESDLFSGDLDRLRAELATIRHEHFNARSPPAKRKWREADAAKRAELARALEQSHALSKDAARQLATWDPYDQNTFAPFFDPEWMFGLPVGKVRLQGKAPATLLGNLALINDAGGQTELTPTAPQEVDSGFDIVIGNPPYIRIQTLKQKNPGIVAFYKEHYASAAKGNYDIYVVFIEAGLRLLKSDGHLAYICPHKFFNQDYGESLRGLVSRGRHLRHVVHFGDQQVFLGATIYTCLLFLSKGVSASARFSKPESLVDWLANYKAAEATIPACEISTTPWNFTAGAAASVMDAFSRHPNQLGDVASRIFQGLVTGADPVFIMELAQNGRYLSAATGEAHEIEAELMHPLCKGSVDIRRYRIGHLEKAILFPYKLVEGRAELISVAQFKRDFPKAWKYLLRNRDRLESREGGKWAHERWYAFGRSQNLSEMEQTKVLTPSIAASASFTIDVKGAYYFVGSGGGGGGGYGVTVRPEANLSLHALLGILNSAPADFFLKRISTPFANGYFAYNRQFIEQIPIPAATEAQQAAIERLVDFLLWLNRHIADHPEEQTTRDPMMVAYWERVLNGLVYELYFPEEVHGAGLRLFDLVAQAALPEVTALPEPQRLPRLRQLFETLHDGAHPLRLALDKLSTLDTIRIIEGKE